MKFNKHIIGYAATALVAITLGAASAGGPAETIEVEKPVVKTKTVKVEVTPNECKAALDTAEQIFVIAGEGFNYAGDGFGAAASMDMIALNEAASRMENVAPRLKAQRAIYDVQAEKCRG